MGTRGAESDYMTKRIVCLLLAASSLALSAASFPDGRGMFERRLGMFVHWGIYAVGAWHEQERMRLGVPRAEYEAYAERFAAERFDADAFVAAAKSLDADYIVFTAKHHDGFCLWDTATTDFKVTRSPCGRDVLKELSAAQASVSPCARHPGRRAGE